MVKIAAQARRVVAADLKRLAGDVTGAALPLTETTVAVTLYPMPGSFAMASLLSADTTKKPFEPERF